MAEICLWKFVLSANKLGYKFNRQRPVLNYIADFMCKELKLIIEVDGITHDMEEVKNRDLVKQKVLEAHGFKILRFTDEDVLKNIDHTKRIIEETINELLNKSSLNNEQ